MTSKIQNFLCLLCIALTGCATINMHGHEVDPAQLKKVEIGVTTKKQIMEMFGTPSAVSTFGNNSWFYVSETTSTRAFLNPVVLKSNVTRFEFDAKGIVQLLDSLSEVDRMVVAHVHRTTPTAGHQFGFFEQMFGNMGRFNGKDPDK